MKRILIQALLLTAALGYAPLSSATSVFVSLKNATDHDLTMKAKSAPPVIAKTKEGRIKAEWYEHNEPKDIKHHETSYFGMRTPVDTKISLRPQVTYEIKTAENKRDTCVLRVDSLTEKLSLRCKNNLIHLSEEKHITRNGWIVFSATINA